MPQPTREELERLADTPKGTYALMLVAAALLFVGWVIFYFGRFLGNGPVR
jgi:cation transport ATPase